MLKVFLIAEARVGIAIDEGVVVELFVFQFLVGARHQGKMSVAGWEFEVSRCCLIEVFAHSLNHLTQQGFGEELVVLQKYYM